MGIISEYVCCSDEDATIDTRTLPPYHGFGGRPFGKSDSGDLSDRIQPALPIHRFGCNTWGKIMHYCTSDALAWWDQMAARVSKPVSLFFLCDDTDNRYFSIHLDPVAKHASWAAADEHEVPRKLFQAPKRRRRLTQPKRLHQLRQQQRREIGLRNWVSTEWDQERWSGMPDVHPERFAKALPNILRRLRPVCTGGFSR